MSEDIITQLKEVFTPIASKIGEGAEFGWIVVVKQQYVEATIGLFFALIGFITLILTYRFVKKNWEELGEGDVFIALMIGIASAFSFFIGSTEAITHFINPEYYAIEFFINLVK